MFTLDFNTFFNLILTGVVAFITYTVKESTKQNNKKHEQHEKNIKELKEDLDRNFITKEEHYRDINSLDKKIDGIKDILLELKQDIGKLIGGSKGGK